MSLDPGLPGSLPPDSWNTARKAPIPRRGASWSSGSGGSSLRRLESSPPGHSEVRCPRAETIPPGVGAVGSGENLLYA